MFSSLLFRPSITSSLLLRPTRTLSSRGGNAKPFIHTPHPPHGPTATHKKGLPPMLGDPATYPLIIIVASAMTMASGFLIYHGIHSPDVRLNKKERQALERQFVKEDKEMVK